ncbi:hypothetical protein LPB142_16290 [Rhodobacter xanthinilyticus]|uniref:histidine kinase n=1 Tax=Rhodobacter xanthinilyticus TaxID=1850250 RepID=A0A1D9MG07_9RHOB|nr:ATP-binding protein [Rhodobacter xanthinilyticus]AOZ70698.1 hypothetical protein LPB142_16290 [Rhodobacter xanthinilyticus]
MVRAAIFSGLLVCISGIALLTLNVAQRIADGATANRDSGHWTLSQAEVELLALDVAIHEAHYDIPGQHAAYAEVRRRFDIFYSRILTISTSDLHTELSINESFLDNFQKIKLFLFAAVRDIDDDDAALAAALPDLQQQVLALRPSVRAMALSGLSTLAQTTATAREQVEQTLTLVAALTVVSMMTLLAMVAVLLRMDAVNRTRRIEIEASAAHMAAIVATAQDAVVTMDGRHRITSFNTRAEQMFGLSAERAIGANAPDLLLPEDQRSALCRIIDEVASHDPGEETRRQRLLALSRKGTIFPVELSITAANRPGPRLLVAFLRDLTAEVAAEENLLRARDRALAGERAKAELLAVMSHEIRTPLNGLLGTTELLALTRLTRKQRDYVHILESAGNVLLQHVNDVLEVSRHDNRQVPTVSEPVNLAALAHDVIDNQVATAAQQGSCMVLCLPDAARCTVFSDTRLLKQVLLNLVGNAVKFTRNGTITLNIRHLGPDGPTEFSVQDTGIGIAPQDLRRIFDDFVTLDTSYVRPQGGTGLGLGIARRVVAQLGGTLTAESQPGQGSTFRFSLALPLLDPVQDQPPRPGRPSQASQTSTLDVLMIEDNANNRLVLGEMLTRLGHRVTEAEDGAQGLIAAAQRRYDLILMDISMPNMDGLQATAALRDQPGPNVATPIIALTAHAMPDEQQRFRAAGMADVLIKPISMTKLNDILHRVCPAAVAVDDDAGQSLADAIIARRRPAFIAEAEDLLARIAELADEPDTNDQTCALVHRLTGSARLFGADRLATRLALIETHFKTGNPAAARTEIAALPWYWQHTKCDLTNSDAPPGTD